MLGSSRTRSTRVRVVSATNADLPALIREGRFREDLYYRLNVIEIALPPLAERPDDILPLAEHFLGPSLHSERRRGRGAAGARLAGQCARAAQLDRTRQAAGAGKSWCSRRI